MFSFPVDYDDVEKATDAARTHKDTNNYAVEFSPYRDGLLAVASSQYFGIVGNGKQIVMQLDPAAPGGARIVRVFDTQDGLFDTSWNESNEHQMVSASGDGSVKLFDLNARDGFPVGNWKEHTQECSSVDWALVRKDSFVTGSWDASCKLWDPMHPRSLRTFAEHTKCVYNAVWSPRQPNSFVSCSGDTTFKVWDLSSPRSALTVPAHDGEVLTVDWSKYNEFVVVTGATDRSVRVWDLRRPYVPINTLWGHDYAVRRLKCSPHDERHVLTCSYDMTAILWDILAPEDALVMRYDHHTEFILGVDFSLFRPGQVATASWDEYVCVFDVAAAPPRIPPVRRKAPPPVPLGPGRAGGGGGGGAPPIRGGP